jgi:hypothetical protein
LTERLQNVRLEFCELVQKQDPVMRAGNLAWLGQTCAASNQPCHRHTVMRRAKRTRPIKGPVGRKVAKQAPDLRYLHRLLQFKGRQDAWEAASEHRLAGARWAAQ